MEKRPHAVGHMLAFTPLGFGGAPLGNLYAEIDDGVALEAVHEAYAAGIRYFDTAPHYGNGLSEHRIGMALRGVARESFVLSSKVGRVLVPDSEAPREQNGYVGVLPFRQHFDYSYDATLRSIDDSLQRLGLAYLDIVYIHDIDAATHGSEQRRTFVAAMQGAYRALARLRDEGVIAGVGLGVNDWQVCLDALGVADLEYLLLAGRYTLLDQSALPALLPECERRGVRIILGGPYNSGILATGAVPSDGRRPYFNYAPASEEIVARVAAIERLCSEFRVPLRAAALQFPCGHSAVVNVLPGARNAAEIRENLRLARLPIPTAFWQALREHKLIATSAPLPTR